MITYEADTAKSLDAYQVLAAIQDPGERIATIVETWRYLEDLELAAVIEMREAGTPWSEIAGALGVSREAAWQRYHHQTPTVVDDRLT